ncbi:MAG: YggS family pyridoxal phosphate-dependent enzyme [Acidimicrobiia bacterium]|nr:YggS family pyridoxal phosphate-dependent enzyme [Acidimicrobiia bacterium]MDH5237042.1 YggS family pyridoxal phosphate-dependent enzyme [Acidimicrobiia bacterium]
MSTIAQRLAAVRDRLDAAGGTDVVLVGVAKTFGSDDIRAAVAAGLHDVGESYAQELRRKLDELEAEPIRWHFVGGLQRNKVRHLAGRVHLWHSIDRPELVDELARRDPGASMLVQVNSTGEPQKAGCSLEDAPPLVQHAASAGLDVQGLMTIGRNEDMRGTEQAFTATRRLADELDLGHCSMGMSADLELAVHCGSTMVRVGRDIFGNRI